MKKYLITYKICTLVWAINTIVCGVLFCIWFFPNPSREYWFLSLMPWFSINAILASIQIYLFYKTKDYYVRAKAWMKNLENEIWYKIPFKTKIKFLGVFIGWGLGRGGDFGIVIWVWIIRPIFHILLVPVHFYLKYIWTRNLYLYLDKQEQAK